MAFIEVRDLVKTFSVAERAPGLRGALAGLVRRRRRTVRAVDGISFAIARGGVIGLIGPNGAGKSTTVKALCGILMPDGGEVLVAGRVPWRERQRHVAGLGAVFGQRSQLWWDLPLGESFDLLGTLYRVERPRLRQRIDELVALLGLGGVLAQPVRTLSLGQRMRGELAAALLHAPPLLILDEPTIGLDAPAKLALRAFLAGLPARSGTTVLLTTHDLDDVEALCPRVLVINHGRLLVDGTLADLRERVGRCKRLVAEFAGAARDPAIPGARTLSVHERRLCLEFDPARLPPAAAIAAVAAVGEIADLAIADEPIEEVIARLYRAAPAGAAP